MTRRRGAGERGSATVWMLAVAGVLAVVGAAAVLVGAAMVARHRATSAADLSALAGAGRAVVADPAACAAVAGIAEANSAELVTCSVGEGAIVDVEVRVTVSLGLLGVHSATARARAGPAAPGAPSRPDPGVTAVR
jgi:secretion/DNA translocation related TadE-like protein